MPASRRTPRHNWWLLLALGLFLLIAFLLFDPKLYTGGDNAVYLILAQSLARGTGYSDINLPVPVPHTQYPPGFPALLAPLVLLFGGVNVFAAKLLVLLCGIAVLVFGFRLMDRALGGESPWPVVMLVSMPVLALYSTRVLSDIPFLLLLLMSLWFLLRAEDGRRASMWAGLALAAASLLFRTAGVALVLGIAVHLLLRRRWRWLGVLALMLCVGFVPWLVRNAVVGTGRSYLDLLLSKHHYMAEYGHIGVADFFVRVWNNLAGYGLKMVPLAAVPLLGKGIAAIVSGIVIGALAATGFIRRLKSKSVLEPVAVCFGLMLLVWPDAWQDVRFLLPLLPLLVIYVVTTLRWLGGKMRFRYLVPALAVAVLALNTVQVGQEASQNLSDRRDYLAGDEVAGYPEDWQRYFGAIDWVKAHVPRDQVIMARKPEFVYLMSGRRSFCYPFVHDSTQLTEAVFKSDYIIFDNFRWNDATQHFLTPILNATPERFLIIRKIPSKAPGTQAETPVTFVIKVRKIEPASRDVLPAAVP